MAVSWTASLLHCKWLKWPLACTYCSVNTAPSCHSGSCYLILRRKKKTLLHVACRAVKVYCFWFLFWLCLRFKFVFLLQYLCSYRNSVPGCGVSALPTNAVTKKFLKLWKSQKKEAVGGKWFPPAGQGFGTHGTLSEAVFIPETHHSCWPSTWKKWRGGGDGNRAFETTNRRRSAVLLWSLEEHNAAVRSYKRGSRLKRNIIEMLVPIPPLPLILNYSISPVL